ncbi:hypothetical protein SADUNF_Sadunf02G0105200 [Salix dunnii]|uniref:Uncharacterized protein n=1 Tax=Salix dunnii TaxID=1413687 RepID=A0A835N774_9ROSI|nr:hypothetical protein SADUNF_Sadunf02G0105200 [Salix dunnii]
MPVNRPQKSLKLNARVTNSCKLGSRVHILENVGSRSTVALKRTKMNLVNKLCSIMALSFPQLIPGQSD